MAPAWYVRNRRLPLTTPLVMGVVNVTPDSFSDGGRWVEVESALAHARRLVDEGADILDLGGESTRPGSAPVAAAEQLRRLLPVVRELARTAAVPLSIDTQSAAVAAACLEAGAHIVNDVSALRAELDMIEVIARTGAGVVLMHMQGTPATMQAAPHYDDVVSEVYAFLQERIAAAEAADVPRHAIAVDPGIGFGKTLAHNLALLANLDRFQALGVPLCLGVSRKGFIGTLCGREVNERLAGSVAAASFALAHGTAAIVRVHDVAATRDAVRIIHAVRTARPGGAP